MAGIPLKMKIERTEVLVYVSYAAAPVKGLEGYRRHGIYVGFLAIKCEFLIFFSALHYSQQGLNGSSGLNGMAVSNPLNMSWHIKILCVITLVPNQYSTTRLRTFFGPSAFYGKAREVANLRT